MRMRNIGIAKCGTFKRLYDVITQVNKMSKFTYSNDMITTAMKKRTVKPFILEEFYSRNNQSQKEIRRGKLIDHKAVKAKYGGK
jgi:hypothetical protein